MRYLCPVCGFPDLHELPHSEETGGSYEICPSCGFQSGISDEDRGFSHDQWRREWIENGTQWRSVGMTQPEDWNPAKQLERLKNELIQDERLPRFSAHEHLFTSPETDSLVIRKLREIWHPSTLAREDETVRMAERFYQKDVSYVCSEIMLILSSDK